MRIIRITAENLEENFDDLIAMGDEFIQHVCDLEPRGVVESREVLRSMVAAAPNSVILKMETSDGSPIGLSYYNYGTGYACGGAYLWLNSIYIRPEFRGRGFGSLLLDSMIADGNGRGIKLFITSRDLENEESERLFASSGFTQKENVIMEKCFP